MRLHVTRVSAATVAGITALSLLGLTGADSSAAATRGRSEARAVPRTASHAAAVSGAPLWVRRYNGPGNKFDFAASVAAGSGGRKVFVTGYSTGKSSGSDYATVAYNAATGARLWVSRYNGPGNGNDNASALAVSPDGGMVVVTGHSGGGHSGGDYATVAYNAATGARLWVSRYNGPANRADGASSVAVSPSGSTVFVTGTSAGATSGRDYLTVAYSAATGSQLWVSRYNGPANRADIAATVAVTRAGGKVIVTGTSAGAASGADYVTVAYDAASGARLWSTRYDGPGHKADHAASLVIGPGSGKVFVTGDCTGKTSGLDYATVAYSVTTGARLWVRHYNGPANRDDAAKSVTVTPSGSSVLVTGTSNTVGLDVFDASQIRSAATPTPDYATVAYSASTGAQLWSSRYDGPGNGLDFAYSVAVSPSGSRVFVTGFSIVDATYADFATMAYSAATGARLWVSRYNGPANAGDAFPSLAVSPAGGVVFVTGTSTGVTSGQDYATIAYRG